MYKLLQHLRQLRSLLQTKFFKQEKAFVYVAIGDSTVEGIGASDPTRSVPGIIFSTILMSRKNASYHNLGKNNATIGDVVEHQLHPAIAQNPDLITISVGANDVRFGTSPTRFRKHLLTLINELKNETHAEIVINSIPDISLTPKIPGYGKGLSNVLVRRINDVIESVAMDAGLIFIDMYSQSKVYARSHPEVISEDGFHPSDFGYAIWANTIISQISHILFPKNISLK